MTVASRGITGVKKKYKGSTPRKNESKVKNNRGVGKRNNGAQAGQVTSENIGGGHKQKLAQYDIHKDLQELSNARRGEPLLMAGKKKRHWEKVGEVGKRGNRPDVSRVGPDGGKEKKTERCGKEPRGPKKKGGEAFHTVGKKKNTDKQNPQVN